MAKEAEMRTKIKLLVFDFDGTLADTKRLWFSSIASVLKKEKIYCPECEAKLIIHFGKKLKEVLETIDIKKGKAEKIAREVRIQAIEELEKAKLCSGVFELENIKAKKIIISNSPTEVIEKFLRKKKIKFFDAVYGEDKFKKKSELIKKLAKNYNLAKKEILYIGDRAGDVKVAEEAGVKSVIVASKHSWNSKKEILRVKPDIVVKSLQDVRNFFEHKKNSGIF